MSGIIPDSILSVDIEGADENGSPEYYCLVSFPQKVIVTGVKFTVNEEMRGQGEDATDWDRVWELAAVKGRKSVGEGDPAHYEDLAPFFGEFRRRGIAIKLINVADALAVASRTEGYLNGGGHLTDDGAALASQWDHSARLNNRVGFYSPMDSQQT